MPPTIRCLCNKTLRSMCYWMRHRKRLCGVLIVVSFLLLIHFRVIPFYRTNAWIECAFDGDAVNVPRIIHQSWKTLSLPMTFRLYRRSWRSCYPKWRHMLWTDAENRRLVRRHFPWFIPTYDSFPHRISRADAVRYMYLYLYGGIYTDLDTECIRPFTHLLNHSIVLGSMEGKSKMKEGHVQNSFMVSAPKHRLWLALLRHIQDIKIKAGMEPEQITGPDPLMIVMNMHRRHCPQDVFIYPPNFFNPFTWMNNTVKACKDFGRMTEAEHQECKRRHSKSYVIQYHAHSWN